MRYHASKILSKLLTMDVNVEVVEEGRGSVVYFNMATMLQSSESGFNSLKEAKKHGMDGLSEVTVADAFQYMGKRIDLSSQK